MILLVFYCSEICAYGLGVRFLKRLFPAEYSMKKYQKNPRHCPKTYKVEMNGFNEAHKSPRLNRVKYKHTKSHKHARTLKEECQ